MTAIAAIVEKGKIWMGGDSAGVAGLSLTVRKDPKVFLKGDVLIGFASSFRMGQLLRWRLKLPNHTKRMTTLEYMHLSFIDAVRKCLKDGGYTRIEYNEELAGEFLIGYQGEIFHMSSDFQLSQNTDNFAAIGCGRDLVLGSLTTTKEYETSPVERLTLALHAAESYSAGVRSPFLILDSKGKKTIVDAGTT